MERRQTEIDSLLSRGRMNKPAWGGKGGREGEGRGEKRWRKRSERWRRRGVMRDRVRLRNQAIKESASEGARGERRVGSE